MAVVQHTDWEKKQLKSIQLFLKQANQAIDYFVEQDKALRDADSDKNSDEDGERSADWLKFRGIVLDLYSVLDYVWYLLYCHFSNDGQRDLSEKGCELGFPYKKKGIKTSEKPEHDQKSKFVKEKLKMIWGDRIGEETHIWREIGKTILSLQPKLPVDNSGAPIGKVQIQSGAPESFALLHFYRNCAAHKDLITFMSKKSWVEINQTTREIRLVTERKDDHEGYFYKEFDKAGFWIQLPGSIPSSDREPSRLLIDVLTQLKTFVVSTASRLLQSALLLPPEKSILECHIDRCEQATKFKTSQDQQEANATAIMKRPIVKTDTKENQVYAEEDACVKMTMSLPQVGTLPSLVPPTWPRYEARTLPNSPYSCSISQCVSPLPHEAKEAAANRLIKEGIRPGLIDSEVKEVECPPIPVQTLMKPVSKTYRMVLNEFKQKVDNLNMMVTINYNGPHVVEQAYYETDLSLIITRRGDNKTLLQISSDKHKRIGKNDSKEAAAQQVLEKCEKIGIIILLPK